jgi:hypothetical protein
VTKLRSFNGETPYIWICHFSSSEALHQHSVVTNRAAVLASRDFELRLLEVLKRRAAPATVLPPDIGREQ